MTVPLNHYRDVQLCFSKCLLINANSKNKTFSYSVKSQIQISQNGKPNSSGAPPNIFQDFRTLYKQL